MFAAASREADLDGQQTWHVQTGTAESHRPLPPPPPSVSIESVVRALPEASIMVPSVWRD